MARFVALLLGAALPGAHASGNQPGSQSLINDIAWVEFLNQQNSTWVAGLNPRFEGFVFDDARGLLGTAGDHISEHLGSVLPETVYAKINDSTIPAEFDARQKWPGLIHPIRDQQQCGSCWAFSAAEAFGDRVSIANGKASPVLSPEEMVSCDKGDMGCSGGRLASAWKFIEETGLVSESCFPYAAGDGTAPKCASSCADGESWAASTQKAKTTYAINGETNMQKEIMTNGPIQVAFTVYKSFMNYKSGVYQKHFFEFLPEGGHAVKILGWGVESGVNYWLVANSWNTNWGMDGFFKIRRGHNECGIEKMGPPYAGMPASSSDSLVI